TRPTAGASPFRSAASRFPPLSASAHRLPASWNGKPKPPTTSSRKRPAGSPETHHERTGPHDHRGGLGRTPLGPGGPSAGRVVRTTRPPSSSRHGHGDGRGDRLPLGHRTG